jgi:hypothetical protein
VKDVVEERLFVRRRDLLTRLDLVFSKRFSAPTLSGAS